MDLTIISYHTNNSLIHPGRRNIWRITNTYTGDIIPDQKRDMIFDNLEREYAEILCRTLDRDHVKGTTVAINVHGSTTFGPNDALMSEAIPSEIGHLVTKGYLPVY